LPHGDAATEEASMMLKIKRVLSMLSELREAEIGWWATSIDEKLFLRGLSQMQCSEGRLGCLNEIEFMWRSFDLLIFTLVSTLHDDDA
jgi:hypothetical protein